VTPSTPVTTPDHAADGAAQHAADRSGRLVAACGALLDALDQPLRIHRRRRAEKHDDNCPKREMQSRLRARFGVGLIIIWSPWSIDLAGMIWSGGGIPAESDIIVFASEQVYLPRPVCP
jgi:hypothetical protein